MLLIHQGGKVPDTYEEQGCNDFAGDILPILDKLDPAITTVISGHTHNAYVCTLQRGGAARLLTSAGKYGFLYTDVRLSFDPATHRLIGEHAVKSARHWSERRSQGRRDGRSLCRRRRDRWRNASSAISRVRRQRRWRTASRRSPT